MTSLILAWLLLAGAPPTERPPEEQGRVLAVAPDPAAGYRPRVRVGAALDDAELEAAVRSGVPLRMHVRVELWEDRLFDRLAGSERWSAVLTYEPLAGVFVLHRRTSGPRSFSTFQRARSALERVYSPAIAPRESGTYYYLASLRVETLSPSDLEELEHWMRGELTPAVRGERSLAAALGRGLRRVFIRLLGLPARQHETRSERFDVFRAP